MHSIRTECVVPASPDKVWAVLADFATYSDWNPLNVSAKGEARLGASVPMVFLNLASRKPGATLSQTVKLVACEPARELAWAGYVPLLFKGRHGFLLTRHDGGTHVLQTEDLSGFVPSRWTADRIARDFLPHYEAVNVALARRVAATG